MRRAISNLLDNAIKYGGAAAVTLALKAGRAMTTVEDEGPRDSAERAGEGVRAIGLVALVIPALLGLVSVFPSLARSYGTTGDITLSVRKVGGVTVRVELPICPGATWRGQTSGQAPVAGLQGSWTFVCVQRYRP
jgi:hypothetical protein